MENNASGSGGSNSFSALSYTGTGTNSASSPASVTFPTKPKFIWFIDGRLSIENLNNTMYISSYPTNFTQVTFASGSISGYSYDGFIKWSNNTMYWYNAKIVNTTGPVYGSVDALFCNNTSGVTYTIAYY